METVGIDLESKYTYFPPFPKLERLAALSVALNLWNYYYSHYHTNSCDYELEKVNEIVNDMKMPNSITEEIIELCDTIYSQLQDYGYDHSEVMMMCNCNAFKNTKHFFLYGAVWDTNGHIDLKKTAEKVLKCPERRLNNHVLMFHIMANYCLENYMKDFPWSSLSNQYKTRSGRRQYEVINYWIEFKRNEEKASDNHRHRHRQQLLDSLKRDTPAFWPLYVYEYFWYFLDENEQVTVTRNFIQRERTNRMFFLFSKLNRHQLRSLYLEEPAAIIINYFRSNDFELIHAAWAYVRSTIKEEQFGRLINEVLEHEMYCNDNSIRVQCFIDLWSSAPDNLINYLINVKNCAIAEQFFHRELQDVSPYKFNFLKVILPRATLEFRKQFFLDKGLDLILAYSDVFSTLIEHCLDVTDQMEIKEKVLIKAIKSDETKILRHFRNLLYSSVEEFNEFLTYLTLEPNLQTRVKKRLLRSRVLIIRKLNRIYNWAKVCQFIDELYSNDEKEARKQKKKAVNSFLDSHFHYGHCFRRNGDEKFTEIENFMSQFLTPEEIATAKKDIIDYFQSALSNTDTWRRFDLFLKRVNIPKLIAWCYDDDEEKISQFKSLFPIDTAFQLFLRETVERYVNDNDTNLSFSALEQLLCWKFSSKIHIKKFKRRQIHRAMRSEVFPHYICDEEELYPRTVKKIIAWIFDDNEFKVEAFEQLYQKEGTIKIIHWLHPRRDCHFCREYTYHSSDESD
ncbi:uncharacterized protein LOC135836237 isoform X2 [Planococcus citri]|uniref:uncharacterized protein LOC135836237 isoform X2 n=1 Tax=Planococcus citri TaxID=170843 RepID=UPI0031F9FE29